MSKSVKSVAISGRWCQDNQSINKTRKQEHELSVIKIGWFQGDQNVNKQGNKELVIWPGGFKRDCI